MSKKTFIQRLQDGPVEQRKKFAIIISAICASAVFIIFLILFLNDIGEYRTYKASLPKEESVFSKISKSYSSYKEQFEQSPLVQQLEKKQYVDDVTKEDKQSTTSQPGQSQL